MMREREKRERIQERERGIRGCSRTALPLGALGLAPVQATPGGGAGRRRPLQKREGEERVKEEKKEKERKKKRKR